jgi:hypothetical protein
MGVHTVGRKNEPTLRKAIVLKVRARPLTHVEGSVENAKEGGVN